MAYWTDAPSGGGGGTGGADTNYFTFSGTTSNATPLSLGLLTIPSNTVATVFGDFTAAGVTNGDFASYRLRSVLENSNGVVRWLADDGQNQYENLQGGAGQNWFRQYTNSNPASVSILVTGDSNEVVKWQWGGRIQTAGGAGFVGGGSGFGGGGGSAVWPVAVSTSGLDAYYLLDETSGTRSNYWQDFYHLQQSGTLSGVAGLVGNAVTNNGSTNYLAANGYTNSDHNLTVILWVNQHDYSVDSWFWTLRAGGLDTFDLVNNSGVFKVFANNFGAGAALTYTPPIDTWIMVAGVSDSSNLTLYAYDATTAPTGVSTNTPFSASMTSPTDLQLGSEYNGTGGINGRMDGGAVFSRALGTNELYQLFTNRLSTVPPH